MLLDQLHSFVTTTNDRTKPSQNANDDADDGTRREIAATTASSFVASTPVSSIPCHAPNARRVASLAALGSVAVSSPVASLGAVSWGWECVDCGLGGGDGGDLLRLG